QGNEYVPFDVKGLVGTKKGGNWNNLPSEDWVVLSKAEWPKLLPPREVRLNAAWEPHKEVAGKVLQHFYPPTENTDPAKNRIDEQLLHARVVSMEQGVARARLDGKLRMKHPFYHKDDHNYVEAGLVGYLEFDVEKQGVRSLHLITV